MTDVSPQVASAPTFRLPPGSAGLPFLGDTIPLLTNTLPYVQRRLDRYGPIWRTTFMGLPAAVAIGAEAQRQVMEDNRRFPAAPGYSFVRPILGHSLFDMDGEEHDAQRGYLTPAFGARQYPQLVERLDRVLDRVFDGWGLAGTRTFHREALAAMFAVSCAVAIGLERGPEYDTLLARWQTMQQGLLNPIRLNVWGSPWHAAVAARDYITHSFLSERIAERRASADGPGSDILGRLLQAQAAHPDRLSDEQIIDHLVLLLFTGYETTAGGISWALLELLRQPEAIAEQVRVEVHAERTVDPETPVRYDEIRTTPYTDAFIKETLRLYPAQHVTIRGVTAAWSYADATVPDGWGVLLVPLYTHRSAAYFDDPERFDPARFLEPRMEDRRTPMALLEFGGGVHNCLGTGFAKLYLKTILAKLLRRFELTLVPDQDVRPVFIPSGQPRGGTRIRYAARSPRVRRVTIARPELTPIQAKPARDVQD